LEKGLNFWKNNGHDVLLDSDNMFWALAKRNDNSETFFSREALKNYEQLKGKLDKEITDFRFGKELTAIYIDPTDRCNANCPYCYVPQKIRQNGHSMTKDELEFILEKIKKYFQGNKRKAVIIFHASEPLLVKDIVFGAIKKYSKVFKFGLQTNATLLEKGDVEFLKKYRVGMGISLDSTLPAINNRLRPTKGIGGNFDKAVQAIKWFDGYEGLNIITTVTKFNVKNLPEIVKFLHAKKVPCVLLNPVRLTQKNSRPLKPDDKIFAKYFIKAVDAAINLSQKTGHKIIVGNFANVILAIVAPVARRLMCDISPCGGARCFFTITASGNMVPCGEFIGLKNFSGGNIFNTSIKTAMKSKPFQKIRGRFVENVPECDKCSFRNLCGSPCPAELHALGNIRQKSVFCEFYKDIIKYAFKIIAEGKEKYCLRNEGLNSLEYEYKYLP